MEPDFSNPEEVLQNVGNLDTARMTLRWSLERVRGLERGLSDAQQSLAEAVAARETALETAQSIRQEFEKRSRSLDEKERFVSQMQGLLNDLFKGQVQVADIIRLKEDLEKEKAKLESQVRERLERAESLARKAETDNASRLAEIEGSYAGALSEAQKRFQQRIDEARRTHEADLQKEKDKLERFREESLSEARALEERYHAKMLQLERDFADRRSALRNDFESLREKITQEQREIWERRRCALERDLADKDGRIARLEKTLSDLEARQHESRIEQAKAARYKLESLQKEFREEKENQIAALRAEHEKRTAEYVDALAEARRALQAREREFQDERMRLIEERDRLKDQSLGGLERRLQAQEEEFRIAREALLRQQQEHLAAQSARHEEELAALRRTLEGSYNDGRKLDKEQAEEDLEALRTFYDAMVAREKIEAERSAGSAAKEIETLRKSLAAAEQARAAEMEAFRRKADAELAQRDRAHAERIEAVEKRAAGEIAALQARADESSKSQIAANSDILSKEIAQMQARLKAAREELQLQASSFQARSENLAKEEAAKRRALEAAHAEDVRRADARIAELLGLRDREMEKYRAQREELQKAYETIAQEREARTRQQDIRELEAVRQHFQKLLEERRRDYEEHAGKLGAEVSRLRDLLDLQEREAEEERRTLRSRHAEELESAVRTRTPGWIATLKALTDVVFGPKVLAGALCATMAAGGVLWWRSVPPGRDYPVSFSHATSLVWRGDELWVSDWYDQAIHRLKLGPKGLAADGRFRVPRSRLTGMAFVGDDIYVADALNKEIQRWRLDKDRVVHEASWPSPGDSPSALHFDGKRLWSADLTSHRIYQHVLDDSLTVLTAYPTDKAPVALFAETDRFWSADSDSRIVFRHRFDDSLTPVAAYHLSELENGKAPLSSFTLRKGRLWIARDGSNTLLERPIESFRKELLAAAH